MTDIDTAEIRAKWLNLCPCCDAGMAMTCTCPPGDYRNAMSNLCDALDYAEARLAAALDLASDPYGDDYSPAIERALTGDDLTGLDRGGYAVEERVTGAPETA